jgi:hypothetical protein
MEPRQRLQRAARKLESNGNSGEWSVGAERDGGLAACRHLAVGCQPADVSDRYSR